MTPDQQIAALALQVEELRGLVYDLQQQVGKVDHPLRESYVFIAKKSGSTFQERTVEGSTFTDFGDGRTATTAPLAMESGSVAVIEIPDNGTMRYVELGGGETIDVRVGAATRDGTNYRWSYAFVEVEQTTAGYGGWTTKSGGSTGTLYNTIEDANGASGVMGNGVDTANLAGTGMTVQPIPSGTVVRAKLAAVTGGLPTYWTSYENGVDGPCDPP